MKIIISMQRQGFFALVIKSHYICNKSVKNHEDLLTEYLSLKVSKKFQENTLDGFL